MRDSGDAARGDLGESDLGAPAVWRRIEGLPPTCTTAIAENPAAVRRLVFEPCADRGGCERLRLDDLLETGDVIKVGWAAGRHDGTHGWLPFLIANRNGETILAVGRDDSRIVLALRTRDGDACGVQDIATTSDRAAIIVGHSAGEESFVLSCGLADTPSRCGVIATWRRDELTGNFAQDIYAAETHIAVHTTPAQSAWRVEWDGSGRIPVGGWWTERTIGEPCAAANDATFYSLFSTPRVVAVSVGRSPGDPPSHPLVAGDDFDALILRTDGEDMAWHQGYDREDVNMFGRVEVWSAPFTVERDALMPHRVAVLPTRSANPSARLGFGRFATTESATAIAIYDLRDGSRQEVIAPDGETWTGGVVYLGPEEIAVASGRPGARLSSQSSVMIIRYDSLGAPIPASEPAPR